MSKFILTLALAFVAIVAQAQMKPVKLNKGNLEFSTAVGLISTFSADKATTIVPPVSLRLDYYLSSNFSLGAYGAFSSSNSGQILRPNGDINTYKNNFYVLGLRGNAVSKDLNHFRIYGGFMLGYSMPDVTRTEIIAEPKDGVDVISPRFSSEPRNQFTYSGFIGAKRYFSPKMAGFAELGYGVSLFNLGLTVKL